jgi:hypothetical protein
VTSVTVDAAPSLAYLGTMRRHVYLLLGCVVLYLLPSVTLQAVYGDSYGWLSGEDCWEPDGSGGWVMHGHPDGPMPSEPSVVIPILMHYLPVFLPTALLVLFLFTPLSRKLDPPKPAVSEESPPDETADQ